MTTYLVEPRRPGGPSDEFRVDDTEQGHRVAQAMRAALGPDRVHAIEPPEVEVSSWES